MYQPYALDQTCIWPMIFNQDMPWKALARDFHTMLCNIGLLYTQRGHIAIGPDREISLVGFKLSNGTIRKDISRGLKSSHLAASSTTTTKQQDSFTVTKKKKKTNPDTALSYLLLQCVHLLRFSFLLLPFPAFKVPLAPLFLPTDRLWLIRASTIALGLRSRHLKLKL